MKKSYYTLFLCIWATVLFSQTGIAPKVKWASERLPLEKLYIQTDHTLYNPGEMVWLRAFLTDGSNKPEVSPSFYINCELTDPQGNLVGVVQLNNAVGQLHEGIQLSAQATGGVYTLRGWTDWTRARDGQEADFQKKLLVQNVVKQRFRLRLEVERTMYQPGEKVLAQFEALGINNQPIRNTVVKIVATFDGRNVHEQTLTTDNLGKASIALDLPTVLPATDGLLMATITSDGITESVARPIPVAQREVVMQFFPEGGDLASGWENIVAFEATDTLGNPIDVVGTLYDSKNKEVTVLESYHRGMGKFVFAPIQGEKYYVKVIGQDKTYELPNAYSFAYAMRIAEQHGNNVIVKVNALRAGIVHLVIRGQDKILLNQSWNVVAGEQSKEIDVSAFPVGIASVTLLDQEMSPYAERLVFLNKQRKVNIDIRTNKDKYQPGEVVAVEMTAKDDT